MTSPIAIIGAGGWGTALAVTLARADRGVRLWVYEADLAVAITDTRENSVYLPGVTIPETVRVSNSMGDVLLGVDTVILAVPSHVYRSVLIQLEPFVLPEMTFISAAKGIENKTLMRMTEVIADVIGRKFPPKIAVLSGPTFAPEVARGELATVVVASPDEALRRQVQADLSTSRFRLYTNADMIGVEIGAAAKNVIAIAAGTADGLGLGSNATAALITRGLAEITRLVVACGGKRETLSGLAGMGDLILTAYGNQSRNRRVGLALGQGRKLEEIVGETLEVAEGIRTAQSTVELARKLGIEMPIAEKMYSVLYGGLRPQDAIRDLMERKLKEE